MNAVLLNRLKEMPARHRQYDAYEHLKKTLQGYAKMNLLLVELKSEAVRERHWKQLTKRLGVSWTLHDLTLGQLWDVDLNKHETTVKEVLAIAQGLLSLSDLCGGALGSLVLMGGLFYIRSVWKEITSILLNGLRLNVSKRSPFKLLPNL